MDLGAYAHTLTLSSVFDAARAKILKSCDDAFSSRTLFPFDEGRTAGFYELKLAPLVTERTDPHPPGTVENPVVTAGSLELVTNGSRYLFTTGDVIHFKADIRHEYRNPGGAETICILS